MKKAERKMEKNEKDSREINKRKRKNGVFKKSGERKEDRIKERNSIKREGEKGGKLSENSEDIRKIEKDEDRKI